METDLIKRINDNLRLVYSAIPYVNGKMKNTRYAIDTKCGYDSKEMLLRCEVVIWSITNNNKDLKMIAGASFSLIVESCILNKRGYESIDEMCDSIVSDFIGFGIVARDTGKCIEEYNDDKQKP